MSGSPIPGDYVKAEGQAGRIGARLMAIVAECDRGRVYLSPVAAHEIAAQCDPVSDVPVQELPRETGGGGRTAFWCVLYGLTKYDDKFTKIKDGLVPFVERELKSQRAPMWLQEARAAVSPSQAHLFASEKPPRVDSRCVIVSTRRVSSRTRWRLVGRGQGTLNAFVNQAPSLPPPPPKLPSAVRIEELGNELHLALSNMLGTPGAVDAQNASTVPWKPQNDFHSYHRALSWS
jgi:hypothetical protein